MTQSALTTEVARTSQQSSRGGRTIDHIVLHHAATVNMDVVLSMMTSGSREVSANYVVKDGRLASVVPEELRSWSLSSEEWDGRSVTFEIANSVYGEPWPVSNESHETVAKAVADIAARYSIPLDRDHVIGHREVYTIHGASYATACPGGLDLNWIVARAVQITNGTKEKNEMTSTYNYITDDDAKAELGAVTGNWWARASAFSPLYPITDGQASEAFAADGISDGPFNYPHLVKSRSGKWLLAAVKEDNANLAKAIKAHPLLAPGTGSGGGSTVVVPTAAEVAAEVIRQMKLPGN